MDRLSSVSPLLASGPLGQYVSLLWHPTLSPLAYGVGEVEVYCLNVVDCIAAVSVTPTDRRAAWHAVYLVALDAAAEASFLSAWRARAGYLAGLCAERWEAAVRAEGLWLV